MEDTNDRLIHADKKVEDGAENSLRPSFFDDFIGQEQAKGNLRIFIEAAKSRKEAFEAAQQILNEVGLGERLNHNPAELSGGQQQRVALARAVVTKPSLILADEPTGNLDSELSEKIFSLLQQLVKNYKISCLVVTHNIELAKRTDRIITFKDGKI
jgi:lipoprotein-releasing system ATP-binding protein